MNYLAIFEPERRGYSVYFPTLDGCCTQGDTLAEAMGMAADALGAYLRAARECGQKIPTRENEKAVNAAVAAIVGLGKTPLIHWIAPAAAPAPISPSARRGKAPAPGKRPVRAAAKARPAPAPKPTPAARRKRPAAIG